MLQSTRRRRNSKNSDYQWAELEKKRIEQTTQELKERTRATQVQNVSRVSVKPPNVQEAARKKVEDTEKKVKEEAEKLVCNVFVLPYSTVFLTGENIDGQHPRPPVLAILLEIRILIGY